MMQHMAAYAASSNITTELIQKYLDENKQLILAILDNQNLGKINECATYQAKLQQNLMYLAAIADAQPQQAGFHAAHTQPQAAPAAQIQPAQQYLQQQQLFMSNQRNSSIPQYLQQSQQASQQSFYTQQAIMSSAGGGGSGLQMLSSDNSRGMAGDNGPHHHHHHQLELQSAAGFSDGGSSRDHGNNIQSSQQLGLQRGHDQMHHAGGVGGPNHLGVSSPLGHRDIGGSGQGGGDDSEASYLKGSDASSL